MPAKASTLPHLILSFPERSGVAIKYKQTSTWKEISWPEYYDMILKTASALHQMGVRKNTKVALISNTRWEWSVVDLAVLSLGAQLVPIYQTVTPEDFEFILGNCEAEILIFENKSLYQLFRSLPKSTLKVKTLISFENLNDSGVQFFTDLIKKADTHFEAEFQKSCLACRPGDIATILYTSGTTGIPKGVALSHDAAFCEVSEAFPLCGVSPKDISLSFLPYSHIFGRIEHWGQCYIGFTLAFAESIEKIRNDLRDVRPTIMVSVPRIFEKIYAAVQAQMEGSFAKKTLSEQALKVGKQVSALRLQGSPIPLPLALQYQVAKKLVLNKIKEAFGGRLRFAVSGGAPLHRDISSFFHACDILILEGYGLTETTAAICVNTPFDYQFGSVGKPIGETQIKIAEDGEILVKSRKVMTEYFKNSEATREALHNGWFSTGDIGEILPGGQLKITDRKKDLIKTAGGKYVAPQKLESLLQMNPMISNALIHGDQKKFIVALLALDKNNLIRWAQEKNISYADYAGLTQSPAVQDLMRKALAETNSQLAHFESIKRFAVLNHELTVEAGELTPSLKVKRKVLDQKFAKEIEKLYS